MYWLYPHIWGHSKSGEKYPQNLFTFSPSLIFKSFGQHFRKKGENIALINHRNIPSLSPLGCIALLSPGQVFLFTDIAHSSKTCSAWDPSTPLEWRSTSTRWLSVPPTGYQEMKKTDSLMYLLFILLWLQWSKLVKISQNFDILHVVKTCSKNIYRSKWVDRFWLVKALSCIVEGGQNNSKNQSKMHLGAHLGQQSKQSV